VDGSGRPSRYEINIPQSFLDMPRWWTGGTQWLAALPKSIETQCATWDLDITGNPAHGSNAIAIPVTRNGEPFILRMTPPGQDVADQIRALRFWAGRGTVNLIQSDPDTGAMLLERLSMDESLRRQPVANATAILGRIMRRLAIPAPPDVPSTADIVRTRAENLEQDWYRLHKPFDKALLTEALDIAAGLSVTDSDLAVNGDLHSDQVLRGVREPWLTVDPVLLRGDIAYDLARVLWTRIDEMHDSAEIVEHFDSAVREGDMDRDRCRDWVVFRSIDYWLWGLGAGLTDDPRRCRRLVSAFRA
jgi:streptomycin 6-kinase